MLKGKNVTIGVRSGFAKSKSKNKFKRKENHGTRSGPAEMGVGINSLLALMMEKVEVANQKLFAASGPENRKLLTKV